MRILLLAYEWPPITAAQALRWFYLANGLAIRGVSVHVLCPDITSLPNYKVPNHPNIVEHRVWPGPFVGLAQKLSGVANPVTGVALSDDESISTSYLVGLYKAIRYLLDRLIYPDVRTEWYLFARRKLEWLLREYSFDAVISSHEPGVDLLLGLWAQKHRRLPWIVDLADPLCTPYTPRWRRQLDVWFEGVVLRRADKVILTADSLRDVLMRRHSELKLHKFITIQQGAPDKYTEISGDAWAKPGMLHIVFTGNFYENFRSPNEFAKAIRYLNSSDVMVTIAGDNIRFSHLFDGIENVRFVGRLGHFECLALQSVADVLLNIGNAQNYQIPGKIFEYMVAGKVIVHLRGSELDPSENILRNYPSSFVVNNECSSIVELLRQLIMRWKSGWIDVNENDITSARNNHGWSARSKDLKDLIEGVCGAFREVS